MAAGGRLFMQHNVDGGGGGGGELELGGLMLPSAH